MKPYHELQHTKNDKKPKITNNEIFKIQNAKLSYFYTSKHVLLNIKSKRITNASNLVPWTT